MSTSFPASSVPVSPVDAAWLRMDRPTNAMVITTILTFEEKLDHAEIQSTVELLLQHKRKLRQKITKSFGVTRTSWVDDPSFAIDNHVTRVTLPEPHDEVALERFIGEEMSTPLDRERPLWKIIIIDGAPSGGTVMLVRIHHAVGDGIALVRLLLGVSGAGKEHAPAEVGLEEPSPAKSARQAIARGAAKVSTLARLLLLPPDPKTPLRGALGTTKAVAISKAFDLKRLKDLAHARNVHLNDVLTAAIAGALRTYTPTVSVRALVPVFLKAAGHDDGNHFGLVYVPLPTNEPNRDARVARVKEMMDSIKSAPDATVAFMVLGAMGLLSHTLERFGIDLFTMKASMLITNVPGPTRPVQLAGHDVKSIVVWAPTSGSLGLGFSLLTYAGSLRLGVASDVRLIPDPHPLTRAFEAELEAMLAQPVERRREPPREA